MINNNIEAQAPKSVSASRYSVSSKQNEEIEEDVQSADLTPKEEGHEIQHTQSIITYIEQSTFIEKPSDKPVILNKELELDQSHHNISI